MTLQYASRNSVETLRERISKNVDLYQSGSGEELKEASAKILVLRNTKIKIGDYPKLKIPKGKLYYDAENALRVYSHLKSLTPQQAADDRIWTSLTHLIYPDYVKTRWALKHKDEKKASAFIRSHYFASQLASTRSLTRDNAISRLWWIGHFAHRVDSKKPGEVLDLVFHKQDVRANLIERPGTSMILPISRAIVRLLEASYNSSESGSENTIFERKNFRALMRELNKRGGTRLLDLFGDKEAIELCKGICSELEINVPT